MSRPLVLLVMLSMSTVLSGGCAVSSPPMQRSNIAHSDLKSQEDRSSTLRCGYRVDVLDARASGDEAGHIGRHALALPDAGLLVRERLSALGFNADPGSLPVSVEINQLYLAQNQTNKVPVAVYRVTVADESAWILRSRTTSVSWWGTRDEGRRALVQALDDVDAQLVARLNEHCGRLAANPRQGARQTSLDGRGKPFRQ